MIPLGVREVMSTGLAGLKAGEENQRNPARPEDDERGGKMVKLTEKAREKLLSIIEEAGGEDSMIRLFISGIG